LSNELLADGLVARGSDDKELVWRANAAVAPLNRQYPTKQFPNAEVRIQHDAAAAVCYAVIPSDLFGAAGYFWDIDPAEKGAHARIIRDIFGNPFRPLVVDPAWLIPTVTTLARIIYDDRAFEQMPDLADALEAAGCDNEEVLAHCRGPGEHVRGCWVVDLLLGRE
jgi:hypothetical protein